MISIGSGPTGASIETGKESVVTAGDPSTNCSSCPTYPTPGGLPVPTDGGVLPTILTGNLHGNTADNQRDILWQWWNYLLSVGWFVVQTYDASGVLPAPGVNTWTDYTKLKGTGGGGTGDSWAVIQDASGAQILVGINVTGIVGPSFGWVEITLKYDPLGAFAGGTTLAFPTSATALPSRLQSASPFGTGPSGAGPNPQFYAFVWPGNSIGYDRVAWVYGGKVKQFWQFDTLRDSIAGWTANKMLACYDWGNTDYTVAGTLPLVPHMMTAFGSGGSAKDILTPSPDTDTQVEWGSLAVNGAYITEVTASPNVFSNQFLYEGPPLILNRSGGASTQGLWGYAKNLWLTQNAFNQLDTMGDHFEFLIFGQMIVQWGRGDVASQFGLGSPSTNYPTNRWNGRNTG